MKETLLGFEEKDGAVTEIEVNEVLGFVGNKGSEVAAYNAVPCWAFAVIELWLVRCGWFEEEVFVQSS